MSRQTLANRRVAVTNAPFARRLRPFPFALALLHSRSSRLKGKQTPALPLGAWLRRCATSFVPVLPAPETLRFCRNIPTEATSQQPEIAASRGIERDA